MKNEEKLLINVCQSYFCCKTLEITDNIDWKEFFNIARSHNQIGICHCVFSSNKELDIPQNVRILFKEKFFDLVYVFECQTNALNEVKNCFKNADIPFITFKGAVLRNYYPVPESRTMGDIDLIIKDCDKEKAKKHLAEIGFALISSDGIVDEYKKDNVLLEVHTKMSGEYGEYAFSDAFDNAEFDGAVGKFDDSYHFAYLIAHIANHLRYAGAGIGLLLDLAVMLREREIDLSRVSDILKNIQLDRFADVLLALCHNLFGYGIPSDNNTDRLLECFLSNGVFGTIRDSVDRSSVKDTASRLMQLGALSKDNNNDKKSSFILKLKLAFPPYNVLRSAYYINFLDKRPWLLPAAWVYRFFYNLKHKPKRMLQTIKNIDDNKTIALAEEELSFFEEIGLI